MPGLLPIHDFKSMLSFAKKCRATVPGEIRAKFEEVENDTEGAKNLARDLLCAQVEDLAKQGCPHIHFYTLNRSELTLAICREFAIRNSEKNN